MDGRGDDGKRGLERRWCGGCGGQWKRARLEAWELGFIKAHKESGVDTARLKIKAPIAEMIRGVAKKEARRGPVIHFMAIVGHELGEAETPKFFEKLVVGSVAMDELKRGERLGDRGGKAIDKEEGCGEGVVPIFLRDRSMSKKGETRFHNMPVTAFNGTLLFMGMGTGEVVADERREWRERGRHRGRSSYIIKNQI